MCRSKYRAAVEETFQPILVPDTNCTRNLPAIVLILPNDDKLIHRGHQVCNSWLLNNIFHFPNIINDNETPDIQDLSHETSEVTDRRYGRFRDDTICMRRCPFPPGNTKRTR